MKRYFVYLLIYSIGGFILERIINVIFLGYWYDNSVLYGPYQPLYGNGVVLTVLFYEFVYLKWKETKWIKLPVFILVAIFFTALSEASTGYLYQWITGIHLWNYGQTFTCRLEYVCVLPTSLFGVLSFFVVYYLHPRIKPLMDRIPSLVVYILFTVFTVDVVFTLIRIFS